MNDEKQAKVQAVHERYNANVYGERSRQRLDDALASTREAARRQHEELKKKEEAHLAVASIYPGADAEETAIREREFQAFMLYAMMYSIREVAAALKISMVQAQRDIDNETRRRQALLINQRDHVITRLTATLEKVITVNMNYLTGSLVTPRGINPSANIIRATIAMSNILGITVPVKNEAGASGSSDAKSFLDNIGPDMAGIVLAVAVKSRNEQLQLREVNVTPPRRAASS